MRNLDEVGLVSFLCHELSNPLTALFGKLSIFEMGKREEFEKKYAVSLLSSIRFDADRISRILSEASSATRDEVIGSGFSRKKIKSFELLKKISASFLNDNVYFYLPNEDVTIFVDEFSIIQAFVNIIGNAVKFSKEYAKVTVSAFVSEKNLIVLVSDSGCGIPEESWEKVFDPFVRLNKKDIPGLGIGLYLSKIFILRNDGSLRIKESGDSGTIFEIKLPIV